MDNREPVRTILARMDERLKNIDESIKNTYGLIHGNGQQPGLLSRVQTLEDYHKNENGFFKKYGGILAWLGTTILALYSAIKHQ